MFHELKDGAIIVADSHYGIKNKGFLKFLQAIEANKIQTPQLILLGDNFDLLIGTFTKTIKDNQEAIDLINKIAQKIEVFYFEGNHDFLLDGVFENVKIFPIFSQPCVFKFHNLYVSFAHGDHLSGRIYSLYASLIRSRFFLFFVHYMSFNFYNNYLLDLVVKKLSQKKICKDIENFEYVMEKRLKLAPNVDIAIEGHYHQGKTMDKESKKYINVHSFACSQSYYVVEYSLMFNMVDVPFLGGNLYE